MKNFLFYIGSEHGLTPKLIFKFHWRLLAASVGEIIFLYSFYWFLEENYIYIGGMNVH